nr:insulinase family protein [Clostridium sp. Cult1]
MENLAKIDSVTLSEHYNKILSKAPMEIFFVGEYKGYIEDYLKESFKFKKNDIYKIEREYIAGKVMIKNMIYENMDIDENRLVVGYRTGIPYESSLYNGLLVANNILEDRINAENLGEITRPNKALYLVNSKINKYKSFILMDCSTSLTDIEEIIKKIRNGIDELKKGKFNEDEMRTSKQSIKGSVKAINKNGILISEFFLDKILTEDNRSYNQIIADIDKVTKEEIIEASKELTLDTIYFLRSHQNSIE